MPTKTDLAFAIPGALAFGIPTGYLTNHTLWTIAAVIAGFLLLWWVKRGIFEG